MTKPLRGEVWSIAFDPVKGSEVGKTRPAVVVSSDSLGVLPVKLVVPLTGWNQSYATKMWIVEVKPSLQNGLTKISAAETLQTRSVALERFVNQMGILESETLQQIVMAMAILVELE